MVAPIALLVGEIIFEYEAWNALSPRATLKEYRLGTREDFIQRCKDGEFDGTVGIFRSNESTMITGRFTEEILSVLPKSVKFICHNGGGYDNIDVDGCTRRGYHILFNFRIWPANNATVAGIMVSHTPNTNSNAAADTNIFLMLGALRQITAPILALRRGQWRGSSFEHGHDPENKMLGIIGMGDVGIAVAKRAQAFGMKVQYYNYDVLAASSAPGATYVTLENLLETSDVIMLCIALTESTRHMLGSCEFARMKKGVVIVNGSRGALIDENALLVALEDGTVFSAGLDVFDSEEPDVREELIKNEKVVLLPHIAAATVETFTTMEKLAMENIKSALFDGKLVTPVPEHIK
ncbi:hypothetical protein BP6252_05958 [Coleophoma cylindrospora]|uniref:Uncharacterized protein n=1 Tax=Coleophoma cylindrospora TaxID=1849047 RepID=A0A3D8RLK3_9HELO|nr:hypothetical protein BP6252_05958 [Coleophoma cylindrospora]